MKMQKCPKCGRWVYPAEVAECLYCNPDPRWGLRGGQVEIYEIDPDDVPEDTDYYYRWGTPASMSPVAPPKKAHILIKTFLQTDEEAGGCGDNRRAMLGWLEGDEYVENGKTGIYKNVGSCESPPRERAVRTILIRGQADIVVLKGDWGYKAIMEKYPPRRSPLLVDTRYSDAAVEYLDD